LPVTVRSDSEYLTKGMSVWLPNWKRNGWRTSAKKPVLNRDLWVALDALCEGRAVAWQWVKGHNGDPLNERADALANAAMEPFKAGLAA
jgi:ribonuclease HI